MVSFLYIADQKTDTIYLWVNVAVSVVHGAEICQSVEKTVIGALRTNKKVPAKYTLDEKDFKMMGK